MPESLFRWIIPGLHGPVTDIREKSIWTALLIICMPTEPQMEWHVDYHPYSNPLYRNDFWNDWSSTSGSEYTSYISMNNLWVLTNYLKKIESRYGIKNTDDDGNPDPTGGIRVILGEQGYIAANSSQEASQAAATAYEFYIASANTKVDAIMNRAYLDDSAEGIMTLGTSL